MKKSWDFDKIIERRGSDCIKYDKIKDFLGFDDVLPMWVADMDFETPDFILEAIRKRAEHPILGYSFRPQGCLQAIAGWMEKRHGWTVDPSEIAFSPGVVPGIYLAITAFTQPGDEIIVQPPVYFPFFSTVEHNQRQLILNPLINNNLHYEMDFNQLEQVITPKTRMIIISNPHNPVGRSWSKAELEKLVEICHRHRIWILSDEIHSDLIFQPSKHQPVAAINEHAKEITISFIAPSKTFNLAGLSTSFMIAQSPEIMTKYTERLEATHLGLGNIFGNVAAQASYEHGEEWLEQLLKYLSGNVDLVASFCAVHSDRLRMLRPEATYLQWLDLSPGGYTDDAINQLFFKEARIGINPGPMFGQGGQGFVRLNLAMPRQHIQEGLQHLGEAFSRK